MWRHENISEQLGLLGGFLREILRCLSGWSPGCSQVVSQVVSQALPLPMPGRPPGSTQAHEDRGGEGLQSQSLVLPRSHSAL